ncbi:MAG: enoyl-CoA hydratase-related protein [Ginsengibacter sp.]
MDFSTLKTALENNIFTITINRPEKLNALNQTVLDELNSVMDLVYKDQNIKAVIITGAGEKAFVAGADIAEFVSVKDEDGLSLSKKRAGYFFKIGKFSKTCNSRREWVCAWWRV